MTTDAPTATNPTATDTDPSEGEKRAHAEPMAFLQAIRDALGNGADEQGWPPGTTLQEAAAAAIKERNRLRTALKKIARGTCATVPYAPCPGCYTCIAREALQGSDAQ